MACNKQNLGFIPTILNQRMNISVTLIQIIINEEHIKKLHSSKIGLEGKHNE